MLITYSVKTRPDTVKTKQILKTPETLTLRIALRVYRKKHVRNQELMFVTEHYTDIDNGIDLDIEDWVVWKDASGEEITYVG